MEPNDYYIIGEVALKFHLDDRMVNLNIHKESTPIKQKGITSMYVNKESQLMYIIYYSLLLLFVFKGKVIIEIHKYE